MRRLRLAAGTAAGSGAGYLPAMRAREMSEERTSPFDRFVEAAHKRVSRAPFFALCVVVIVAWGFSYPLFDGDTKAWQVVIHTITSVTTLLLVALLENAGRRDANAAQEKLNVMAVALADLMDSRAAQDPKLARSAAKLREAVGLEERTGT
jgi:low affinity Fe/Cu permease